MTDDPGIPPMTRGEFEKYVRRLVTSPDHDAAAERARRRVEKIVAIGDARGMSRDEFKAALRRAGLR